MAKYVYLEDSILEGFEKLSVIAKSKENQEQMLEAAAKFNEYGFEFQETWNDEMWKIYESTRTPASKPADTVLTPRQALQKVDYLQEIAISLTRMSRGPQNKSTRNQALKEIDKEASLYKNPTILSEDANNGRSCSCIIH